MNVFVSKYNNIPQKGRKNININRDIDLDYGDLDENPEGNMNGNYDFGEEKDKGDDKD